MIARLKRFLQKIRQEKKGVTAIEYALIAALIAVAIIAAVGYVGTEVGEKFTEVGDQLEAAPPAGT